MRAQFSLESWRKSLSETLRVRSGQVVELVTACAKAGTNATAFTFFMEQLLTPVIDALQSGDFVGTTSTMSTVVGVPVANQLLAMLSSLEKKDSLVGMERQLQQSIELQRGIDRCIAATEALALMVEAFDAREATWFADELDEELKQFPESFIQTRNQLGVIRQHLTTRKPSDEGQPAQRVLSSYLDYVDNVAGTLKLARVSLRIPDLQMLYVPLLTSERVPTFDKQTSLHLPHSEETRQLPVLEAVKRYPYLLMLGSAGSGKSTTVSYVASAYARSARSLSDGVVSVGWPEPPLVPVLVPLPDLARLQPRLTDTSGAEWVASYLRECVGSRAATQIAHEMEAGHCILLFDGLDQVSDERLSSKICSSISDLVQTLPGNRVIVTSRRQSDCMRQGLGEIFRPVMLRSLSLSTMEEFIWRVGSALAKPTNSTIGSSRDDLGRCVASIMCEIRRSYWLLQLCQSPLFLTLAVVLYCHNKAVPSSKQDFFQAVAGQLAEDWSLRAYATDTAISQDEHDSALKWFQTPQGPSAFLGKTAWAMHRQESEDTGRRELIDVLRPLFVHALQPGADIEKALGEFVDMLIKQRGPLQKVGEPERFGFVDRRLQNNAAAQHLVTQHGVDALIARFSRKAFWQETIVYAFEYLRFSGSDSVQPMQIIGQLVRPTASGDVVPHSTKLLAGECYLALAGNGDARTSENVELRGLLQEEITRSLDLGRLELTDRLRAAHVLGELGDIRIERSVSDNLIPIDGSDFWMGDPPGFIDFASPRHKVRLASFLIGRYPVTNQEYQKFIDELESSAVPYIDEDWAKPYNWDPQTRRYPVGMANYPVVLITWQEALTYCKWLGDKIGAVATLPSEAEWEKAARGKNALQWPWGNSFHADRCNSSELGLGGTTPVGIFPEGLSPYKVADMAGNIWEWTLSFWGRDFAAPEFRYPYRSDGEDVSLSGYRVVRGGSWIVMADDVRCSTRDRSWPTDRARYIGFRVAVHP